MATVAWAPFPTPKCRAGIVIESNEALLARIVEWVWLPLIGVIGWIGWLWLHFSASIKEVTGTMGQLDKSTDKRLSLLEQHFLQFESKLVDSERRRREDRQELMEKFDKHSDKIDKHHQAIYQKLDTINDRLRHQP